MPCAPSSVVIVFDVVCDDCVTCVRWLQSNFLTVVGGSATTLLGRLSLSYITISGTINSSYHLAVACDIGGTEVPVLGWPQQSDVFIETCPSGFGACHDLFDGVAAVNRVGGLLIQHLLHIVEGV